MCTRHILNLSACDRKILFVNIHAKKENCVSFIIYREIVMKKRASQRCVCGTGWWFWTLQCFLRTLTQYIYFLYSRIRIRNVDDLLLLFIRLLLFGRFSCVITFYEITYNGALIRGGFSVHPPYIIKYNTIVVCYACFFLRSFTSFMHVGLLCAQMELLRLVRILPSLFF